MLSLQDVQRIAHLARLCLSHRPEVRAGQVGGHHGKPVRLDLQQCSRELYELVADQQEPEGPG